jgi:hypothetical protein
MFESQKLFEIICDKTEKLRVSSLNRMFGFNVNKKRHQSELKHSHQVTPNE